MGELSRLDKKQKEREKEKDRKESSHSPREKRARTKEDSSLSGRNTKKEKPLSSSTSSTASSGSATKKGHLRPSSTSTRPSTPSRLSQASSSSLPNPSRTTVKSTPVRVAPAAELPTPAEANETDQPPEGRKVDMESTMTTQTLGTNQGGRSVSTTVPSSFERRRTSKGSTAVRPANISPSPRRSREDKHDSITFETQGQFRTRDRSLSSRPTARKGVPRDTRREWDSESNGDEELTPRPRKISERGLFEVQRDSTVSRAHFPPPPPPAFAALPHRPPHHAYTFDSYFNPAAYPPHLAAQAQFFPAPGYRYPTAPAHALETLRRPSSAASNPESDVFSYLESEDEQLTVSFRSPNKPTSNPNVSSTMERANAPQRIVVKKRQTSNTSDASSPSSDDTLMGSTSSESTSPTSNDFPAQTRKFSPSGKPVRIVSGAGKRSLSGATLHNFDMSSSGATTAEVNPSTPADTVSPPRNNFRRFSGLTRSYLSSLEQEIHALQLQLAMLEAEELGEYDETLEFKKRELLAWAGSRLMQYHQALAAYRSLPEATSVGGDMISISTPIEKKTKEREERWEGIYTFVATWVAAFVSVMWRKFNSMDAKYRYYLYSGLLLLVALQFRRRFWLWVILASVASIWMNTSARRSAAAKEAKLKAEEAKKKVTELGEKGEEASAEEKKEEEGEKPKEFDLKDMLPKEVGIDLPIGALMGSGVGAFGGLVNIAVGA